MSTIEEIVEQALEQQYLTPTMEAEVGRICDSSTELSIEEYMALDKLMGALLSGDVVAVPKKQFINVMEELVLSETITRLADSNQGGSDDETSKVDVGDVAAYALNRLPPLYATTEEGANYQRQKAKEEMQALISDQVDAAIHRYIERPEFYPERQAIKKKETASGVLSQVSSLLNANATEFEKD
jgi:hypothetical protein